MGRLQINCINSSAVIFSFQSVFEVRQSDFRLSSRGSELYPRGSGGVKSLGGHWIAGSPGPVPRPACALGNQLPVSWSIEFCAGFGSRHEGNRLGGTGICLGSPEHIEETG